ncbi:paeninodin family lasso peptide [Alkalihalobacterium alkalinitrilicum]|uniref:paeninodin family lasso peptide n=1 Tax=Alkalihalobacterium alkalinitrilicum TaxID=427920 RepID=UPI00114EBC02|nr:paeninodin family lasso peptide [Alkalihalobacterium alkalinitrilicum]
MKKLWKKPSFEVLDVSSTMGGSGNATCDSYDTSDQPGKNPNTHDGRGNVKWSSGGCGS